jgi:hypothetical protein
LRQTRFHGSRRWPWKAMIAPAAAAAAAHRQVAVAAAGYPRTVHVSLAKPLGGRVLVNLDGTPVPVTAE